MTTVTTGRSSITTLLRRIGLATWTLGVTICATALLLRFPLRPVPGHRCLKGVWDLHCRWGDISHSAYRTLYSSTMQERRSVRLSIPELLDGLCLKCDDLTLLPVRFYQQGELVPCGLHRLRRCIFFCCHPISCFDCMKIMKNNKKSKLASYLFTDVCQYFFRSARRRCLPLLLSSLIPSTMMTRSFQVMGYEWGSGL